MARKWCYSSKAGYEGTPFHHFVMDIDRKPWIVHNQVQTEYVLPSKTKGHYHVIRPWANLLFQEVADEIVRRKGDLTHILCSEITDNGTFYVTVGERVPELLFMERYIKW